MTLRWIPLESNPEVMTSFLHSIGAPEYLALSDVWSLDPEAVSWLPPKTKGFVVLFPITEETEAIREADAEAHVPRPDSSAWFMKQTIGNACGTIALIHAVMNTADHADLTGWLSEFAAKASTPPHDTPESRAQCLETASESGLASAHKAAGEDGQTEAPEADARINLHFLALCRDAGCGEVAEFDGRRTHVKFHGPSTEEEFNGHALAVLRELLQHGGSQVSVLALHDTR